MLGIVRNRGAVFTAMYPFHSFFTYDVPQRKEVVSAEETSMDRIKNIFVSHEHESLSKELCTVLNLMATGTIIGAFVGGIASTHGYVQKFIDENQATRYYSVTDAKRALQDNYTLHFSKGAFRYGWRIGLFSGIYGLVTVICTAYHGQPSILDYTCGGAVAGLIYKLSLGVRGSLVGMIVGGSLGTLCGSFIMLLLRLSGYTVDDIYLAQKQWVVSRDEKYMENMRKHTKVEAEMLVENLEQTRKRLQEVEVEQGSEMKQKQKNKE